MSLHGTGLPRSGKKFWKMKNFPGQGKVRKLHFHLSQCQNSSKFLSVSYLMKTADVIMIFFFFTQYYWSYLIRLADKTEKYWCVNIFFIGLKPHFLAFLPVQRKKLDFRQELLKKTVIFSEILTGCIDKSTIKVNVGGFNMWFFITFFAFFAKKPLSQAFMSRL